MSRRAVQGFTVIELLVGAVILTLVLGGAFVVFSTSRKQSDQVQRQSAAMQNAYVLMETLQQDLKQLAVLPGRGFPVFPYSLALSRHGKSFSLRRSAEATNLGSSFTVVTYQLKERPGSPGRYSFVRTERAPSGDRLPDETDQAERNQALESLVIQSLRTEFVARFEKGARLRHFLELTLFAVSGDRPIAGADAVYPISNLFELPAPEAPEEFCKDAYVEPPRQITARLDKVRIVRGRGNENPLEIPPDVVGASGPADLKQPGDEDPLPDQQNPFAVGADLVPGSRRTWVSQVAVDMLAALGPTFRGRITGEILGPGPGKPAWREPFVITVSASQPAGVPAQVEKIVTRLNARGKDALVQFFSMFHIRPTNTEVTGMFE